MSYREALKFFNLDDLYTEKELKTKYYNLYNTGITKEDNYKQCLKNGSVNVNLYNKLITTKW